MNKTINKLVKNLKLGKSVTLLQKQMLLSKGICPNVYCGNKSIVHKQTLKKEVFFCTECKFQQIQY